VGQSGGGRSGHFRPSSDGRQAKIRRHFHDDAGKPSWQSHPIAKIHPWGYRDLTSRLVIMGF
jgi:hypothetical protein